MKVIVQPSSVHGSVAAPPSKSAMQRACAAALIKGGITVIKNPGISNDDETALDIIQQFGAIVKKENGELIIDSSSSFLQTNNSSKEELEINCGESGLSIRMFTPIAALSSRPVHIVGSGSLGKRPMDFFDDVLPTLSVEYASQNGKLPLQVQGPLKPVNITIDGSLSSQFLTGLLMAYSAAGANDVVIRVTDLKSRPYIDLTLQVMKSFGLLIPRNENFEQFYFPKRIYFPEKRKVLKPPFPSVNYTVEGDWSGAAFLLVAGAIASSEDYMIVDGLKGGSTQADKKIIDALTNAEADIAISSTGLVAIKKSELKAFHFDATDCPDLFPPLVALAAYCKGSTTIKGISRLAHKESNRAITLQEQFKQLGVEILLRDDEMIINSNGVITGGIVHSCHDHRIAMACAVAALGATGAVTIEESEAINKSYPDFYKHLQQLGVALQIYNT